MSGIGTNKVYEDDRVVVWHLDLEPGEQCELHTHELDFSARVLSGSTLEVYGQDGELLYSVKRTAEETMNFRMEGDQVVSDLPDHSGAPATHSVRNVGSDTFREVLIEFKE